MSKKTLPPLDASDLTAVLRERHKDPVPGQTKPTPAALDEASSTPTPTTASSTGSTKQEMTRRSWYMRTSVSDALAELVDELHFQTRLPKHEILSELIAGAIDGRDAAVARLTSRT